MWYVIIFGAGLLTGCLITKFLNIRKRSGNIIVTSDEDGTYFSLQIKDLSYILDNDEVTLGIISQK